ncbi:MAG: VCBS repeat-containing protein, partial [Thermoplasmata archaeon]|nr:VCBS repeat-containing protein [Thermoplasmata archaeon]
VIYRNEGGKLEKKRFWESAETTDCDHIDVLDFNKDGWMDLAATHESHCTLYFNKSGKFNTSPDWETAFIADANQIFFGDYDKDGDPDMLMAAGRPVYGDGILENKTGTPSRTITQKLGFEEYCETAIFADYDGDGDLDVLGAYCRSGKVAAYLNGNGRFDSGTVVYQDSAHPWTQRIYWEDLDKDGEPELFCAKGPWGGAAASVRLVKREGSPKLRVVWKSSPRSAFHGFAFGDVDNDGDLDILQAGGDGSINYYENIGTSQTAVWAASLEFLSGIDEEYESAPALADIDADGDLDLFVGSDRGDLGFYENLGQAVDLPSWTLVTDDFASATGSADITAPTFVDIDGDDDQDMFVGSDLGTLLFFENTGTSVTPSWAAPLADYASIDVGELAVPVFGDLDNDGDYDLLIGDEASAITF